MRTAEISRKTNETQIEIRLDLDSTGKHEIATGIGFLDHMLTHLAVHGLFDLSVQAQGDLEVDTHHTVEDIARLGTLGDYLRLVPSGGSDWHGAGDGPRTIGNMRVPHAWLERQDALVRERTTSERVA